MAFASGAYFSHYSSSDPIGINSISTATTRILCGQYESSYAPVKLTMTDYGQMTENIQYDFRFPLITNPSTTNSPLTYRVRLLSYENGKHYPKIINEYSYENLEHTAANSASSSYAYATISSASKYVQSSVGLTLTYSSYNIPNGDQIIVKFKNNEIPAFTSVTNLRILSNTNFNYEYYPNINLCVFIKVTSNTDYDLSLGTFPTYSDEQGYKINWINIYRTKTLYHWTNFNPGSVYSNTLSRITSLTTSSFTQISGLVGTNSVGLYQIAFKSSLAAFPEGGSISIDISTNYAIVD